MGCAGEVEHQRVGVGEAHRLGHPVLVLEKEGVRHPARGAVQFAPRGEQELGRAGEILHRHLEGGRHLGTVHPQGPADHVVVAQATPGIL